MTQPAQPFVAETIAGPRCNDCHNTEQTCARNYPCCENCTHLFGETTDPTTTCRQCRTEFTYTAPSRPPVLCPDCRAGTSTRPQEPAMTMPATINRDTLAETLARARQVNDPKIRRAVDRIDQAHTALRDLLHEHQSKAEARRDVERLERQLAEARQKLRGGVCHTPPHHRRPRTGRARRMPQRLRPDVQHRGRAREPRTELHRTGRLT